jgi:hypothetical protein
VATSRPVRVVLASTGSIRVVVVLPVVSTSEFYSARAALSASKSRQLTAVYSHRTNLDKYRMSQLADFKAVNRTRY